MQPSELCSDENAAPQPHRPHPNSDVGLHLGCGLDYRPGAISIDRYELTAADLQADALRLPLPRGSVGQIEAQHLAEHLGHAGTLYALAEWRRVLAPGGVVLVETPDRPATCRAAAEPDPPAPILHWLFGLLWQGYTHRGLFHASELRALADIAGLAAIQILAAEDSVSRDLAQPYLNLARSVAEEAFRASGGVASAASSPARRAGSALVAARGSDRLLPGRPALPG